MRDRYAGQDDVGVCMHAARPAEYSGCLGILND